MKALAVVLLLFIVGLAACCYPSRAFALQGSLWSEGTPVITKASQLATSADTTCKTYRQDVFITELGATQSTCIYGDERLKIGIFIENGRERAAVEFPYSNTMHVLGGICSDTCRYSADTDVLATQQQISQYGRGLVLYRHASDRIKRVISPDLTVSYVFDASNPDYEMKNDAGRYMYTPSFGLSSNGRWVVAELYDSGIATVDVDTLTTRQITGEGILYGRGMNPSEELAISDDGKSVALVGWNAGLRVFDVTDDCGQPLVGDLITLRTTILCPSSNLRITAAFPNFASANRPRFFRDGHQLELVVNSWVSGSKRVTFVTDGTPIAHQLKILSLGDSFSSGEGETDDRFYEPGTNQVFDKCHVSTRAYSALIARRLGVSDADAKNLACSGARISDIVGSDGEYWGQGSRLGAAGLKLSVSEKSIAQQRAVDDFQPGRALQSNFIERYNPEILTIGVGGNDAGLMGKLRTCAMPGTCEWAQGVGIKETAGEIRRLYDTLGSFFSRIAGEVGDSRVFIVGYPDIINPEGSCDPVTAFLLDHAERLFIQNSVRYLNRVIRAAANKAGFAYVDIEHSFGGTGLCSGASSTSMNTVRLGDDVAVIDMLPMLKLIGAETFHPTPVGHSLMADTILASYPGMTNSVLPVVGDADTAPSPYWNSEGSSAERSSFVADFAFRDDPSTQHMIIQVPDGTLQPNSTVTVEVRSDPTQLATFVVDERGGIKGTVTIPMSVREGFHTLHLLGMNKVGDQIDMYQFLTIGESGSVAQLGVGEGDMGRRGYMLDTSVSPIHESADVLGVQTTKGVDSVAQKVLSAVATPAISYIKGTAWPVWWLLTGLAVFVIATLLTICAVLFYKRWAKPGS